jgi:thiol-disulfide isomerase/thioredoxin
MSRTRRIITIALCAAVTGTALIPAFIQADEKPATATTTTEAATKPAARDLDILDTELKQASEQFRAVVPNMKLLADAKFRKENADRAIPSLKKSAELLNEIAVSQNEPTAVDARIRTLGVAVALGDEDAFKTLTTIAQGKDKSDAIAAKSALAFGTWVRASEDPKAQSKVLEDYIVLAKAETKDDRIAGTLMQMSQLGAANENLSRQAFLAIRNLNGDLAQQINRQNAALDRPIVLVGRTTANARFNSSTLKGKVILVDFWATWCGPCREALPEIKKLYETYHPQGLEIVGVDWDSADDKVNAFTKENKMPWVQLRELSQTDLEQVHPLAKRFGVDIIPTLFIVDKKGILRYLDGEVDTEQRIKTLLAEPGPEPEKPATPKPAPAK